MDIKGAGEGQLAGQGEDSGVRVTQPLSNVAPLTPRWMSADTVGSMINRGRDSQPRAWNALHREASALRGRPLAM